MSSNPVLLRMMSDFCRVRVAPHLPPRETASFHEYLVDLVETRTGPPRRGAVYDWAAIAAACSIPEATLHATAKHLSPALDALHRALPPAAPAPQARAQRSGCEPAPEKQPAAARKKTPRATGRLRRPPRPAAETPSADAPPLRRRGAKPRPIVTHPEALWPDDGKATTFREALVAQMERHGDTPHHLHRAVEAQGAVIEASTIRYWASGRAQPRTVTMMNTLGLIEARYRLPAGYFTALLPHRTRAPSGQKIPGIARAEMRRLAWHLPHDFAGRPLAEREEILKWIRNNIISGTTEYRRFQAAASKQRYAIRFNGLLDAASTAARRASSRDGDDDRGDLENDPEAGYAIADAPPRLAAEMDRLVRFKISTLSAPGYKRSGVWGKETAAQRIEHLGLMFGALAAPANGPVRGHGVPLEALSFGMLVFPAVWDWYLHWREARRGFFTRWEADMLSLAIAFNRAETGWIRQTPALAAALAPVPGLIDHDDIDAAAADWPAACERMYRHAVARSREIQRVVRVHRDPFEPILPVLEASSPAGEYRKIADEIARQIPDEGRYPVAAAEAVRALLLIRLGLHLGIRQKNLRQLQVCPRGRAPMTERQMIDRLCGELRWSDRAGGWEVVIPAAAFKNAGSSYFGGKPYRLLLPDLGQLYAHIEAYIDRHRKALLRGAVDPGTFFVKTVKMNTANAAYDQNTFYEAWRLVIQRYGIHNPYTRRGAIKGLLPHGPHNVRDVVATHILKQTGSYEQASYAIQDTPETVAKHYGRFLPQDKAALAAQVLNKIWDAA